MTNPDIFPAITAEASLGENIEHLSLDIGTISRLMRRGGLSPNEIEEHTIFLAQGLPYEEDDNSWRLSSFDEESKVITVYVGGASEEVDDAISIGDKWGLSEREVRMTLASYAVSEALSKSLLHEVGHAIDFAKQGGKLHQRDQRYLQLYANRGTIRKRLEVLTLAAMGSFMIEAATFKNNSTFSYGLIAGTLAVWGGSAYAIRRFKERETSADQLFNEYETLPSERRAEHFANRHASSITKPYPLFVHFKLPENIDFGTI